MKWEWIGIILITHQFIVHILKLEAIYGNIYNSVLIIIIK